MRSSPVSQKILHELRRRIVGGHWKPGTRLPTRRALEQQFDASPLTVQGVLHQLQHDGFVRSEGRRGTFVMQQLPHLARYALVLPHPLSPTYIWPQFWVSLANEAELWSRRTSRPLLLRYHGDGQPHQPHYQQLVADLQAHRLAGLIFASHPGELHDTPILEKPDLPRVTIQAPGFARLPTLEIDYRSFIDRALSHLRERNISKLAVLSRGLAEHHQHYLHAALTARGLTCPPYWELTVSEHSPQLITHLVHLLVHDRRTRPQALLICDDNLIRPAETGLVAAGVKTPRDLYVIAHCNFPWPVPTHLPMQRLGFDNQRLLSLCVENLDRQRDGKSVPPVTLLPAVFESDLTMQSTAAQALSTSGV